MTEIVTLPSLSIGQYDPLTDTIEIEGTRYSGELFRALGFKAIIGQVLRIDQHENGVLTVTQLPSHED